MARKKKKNQKIEIILGLIIFIIISILSIGNEEIRAIFYNEELGINKITAKECENIILEGEDILQIHFFDVGQADSILLISNEKTMLIDAGNNEDGNLVVNNIKKLGDCEKNYAITRNYKPISV